MQRAASLEPGASKTLYFTLPPSVLADVTEHGAAIVNPGRVKIRIGGVPLTHGFAVTEAALAEGLLVERELFLAGAAIVVKAPPLPIQYTAAHVQ